MLTVTIESNLAEQISQLAAHTQRSADELVEEAIQAYLSQVRRDKIHAEREEFERQHEQLVTAYLGQYIAMHEGQVIDHDPDLQTLHLRVIERLGRTPVLLTRVAAQPHRELVFRSPRFERNP